MLEIRGRDAPHNLCPQIVTIPQVYLVGYEN